MELRQLVEVKAFLAKTNIMYLEATLAFFWFVYAFETYLDLRQHRCYTGPLPTLPTELRGSIDMATFSKSRAYNYDKSKFSLIHGVFSQVEQTIILAAGVLPWTWDVCGDIAAFLGVTGEVVQSIIFVEMFYSFGVVVELPWTMYKTFVIEERHGFNKQTLAFFIKDTIKSIILTSILIAIVVGPLVYLIQWGGTHFYVYVWFFLFAFSLLMLTIYPTLIAPLFDKYVPLTSGVLADRIRELAASIKFPLGKLYVVIASKRSSHSNAYFYGFMGNKRIVLFDTLLPADFVLTEDGNPTGKGM